MNTIHLVEICFSFKWFLICVIDWILLFEVGQSYILENLEIFPIVAINNLSNYTCSFFFPKKYNTLKITIILNYNNFQKHLSNYNCEIINTILFLSLVSHPKGYINFHYWLNFIVFCIFSYWRLM